MTTHRSDRYAIVRDIRDGTYYILDEDDLPVTGDYLTIADAREALAEMAREDAEDAAENTA